MATIAPGISSKQVGVVKNLLFCNEATAERLSMYTTVCIQECLTCSFGLAGCGCGDKSDRCLWGQSRYGNHYAPGKHYSFQIIYSEFATKPKTKCDVLKNVATKSE